VIDRTTLPNSVPIEQLRFAAEQLNRAHQRMGTRLLGVDGPRVTIGLQWRAELADSAGAVASGVVTALLDHACALAALVALGDPTRVGGTISLRVDQLDELTTGSSVNVAAEPIAVGDDVVVLRAQAYDPLDAIQPIATAISSFAVAR